MFTFFNVVIAMFAMTQVWALKVHFFFSSFAQVVFNGFGGLWSFYYKKLSLRHKSTILGAWFLQLTCTC